MRFELRIAALSLIAAASTILCGSCGYHVGSIAHPQLKTIAVAPVKNDTLEPLMADFMRQNLCEQYQTDGSLKLKSISEADCIVYCKITEIKNENVVSRSTDGQITYRPYQYTIAVTAEFSVVMPGKADPVIPSRVVTETAVYDLTSDPQTGRTNGLKQACYNLARKMVQYTVEAW